MRAAVEADKSVDATGHDYDLGWDAALDRVLAIAGHGWDARARALLDILDARPARGQAVAVAAPPILQEA